MMSARCWSDVSSAALYRSSDRYLVRRLVCPIPQCLAFRFAIFVPLLQVYTEHWLLRGRRDRFSR